MDKNEELLKEMEHRLGIAIESIDTKLGLMMEGMQAQFDRLDRKIDAVRDELKFEIRRIDTHLVRHDRDIRTLKKTMRIA